ncbi:MAG: TIGR03013 family XrtA/PEP-CTERM system glycosyltransferase, partial [Gammaproteobacteria bacterium]
SFIILVIIESVVLATGFYLGVYLRFAGEAQSVAEHFGPLEAKAATFAGIMLLSMAAFGLYDRMSWSLEGRSAMLLRVMACFLFSIFPLSFMFYLVPATEVWRGATLLVLSVSLLGILITRVVFLNVVGQDVFKRRALVLGAGDRARNIRREDEKPQLIGVDVVGYTQMEKGNDVISDRRLFKHDKPLRDIVREENIDEIILAVDDRRKGMPVAELLDCKMDGVDVIDLLTFFERETGRVKLDLMNPSWLFLSDGFRVSTLRSVLKRLFDIIVSLILLPVFLPVMVFVGLAVWLEDWGRGPVFYRQVRIGENNREFNIYKFRSMSSDAEGDGVPRWANKNDPRVTRVGAFIRKIRLDELPQVFNILKGDMSFVGPRPERPEFVQQLAEQYSYYNERHRMKPGLTGWAQINYQYGESPDDAYKKLEYDLYYVKNYSIFLDLLIILHTIQVVMTGKGAH